MSCQCPAGRKCACLGRLNSIYVRDERIPHFLFSKYTVLSVLCAPCITLCVRVLPSQLVASCSALPSLIGGAGGLLFLCIFILRQVGCVYTIPSLQTDGCLRMSLDWFVGIARNLY